jgi:hypothetical protein
MGGLPRRDLAASAEQAAVQADVEYVLPVTAGTLVMNHLRFLARQGLQGRTPKRKRISLTRPGTGPPIR